MIAVVLGSNGYEVATAGNCEGGADFCAYAEP
jgi:hypothetical protein